MGLPPLPLDLLRRLATAVQEARSAGKDPDADPEVRRLMAEADGTPYQIGFPGL